MSRIGSNEQVSPLSSRRWIRRPPSSTSTPSWTTRRRESFDKCLLDVVRGQGPYRSKLVWQDILVPITDQSTHVQALQAS